MKVFIIASKELLDQWRDRRTIAISLILPAVIVPLLLFLISGTAATENSGMPVRIAISSGNDSLKELISSELKETRFIELSNEVNTVESGKAELQIEKISDNKGSRIINIIYDPARKQSALSHIKIAGLLESALRSPERRTPDAVIKSSAIRTDLMNRTLLTLSLIIPVFLTVFAASSTMSGAIDMSAGEKERSTIETLLSSNVSYISVITGKGAAASVIGFISTMSLVAGLGLCSHFYPEITGGISLFRFCGVKNIILLLLAAYANIVLFSATGIAAGFFARSVKEGNILILPVIVLSSALSGGFVTGDSLCTAGYVNCIPLLNTASLMRSIIFNNYSISQFIITIAVTACCASLIFMLGYRLLKTEGVIFRS